MTPPAPAGPAPGPARVCFAGSPPRRASSARIAVAIHQFTNSPIHEFMRVPSYDDLTPQRGSVVGAPTTLFACLYEGGDDVAMPLGDVRVTPPAVAIAREFSPRIAVAGPRMVIVDVAGLG